MQRFPAASGGGVSNSTIGGASARDIARSDSSFSSSNFSQNSRRQPQLTSYKLKCDKEPLNSRLGPPDFYPQTPNCPEETLTKEYVQNGYKETVDGIEETRDTSLTQSTSWTKPDIAKCREAIRKRHRAINESRAQKRKAGQVYGVPLLGPLLTKSGAFPELKQCGEDFRKKWIEGLSQQHKPLHSLADLVPHGYRKKSLFEVLVRHNVPLLRATWFIKVTYLNQVRFASTGASSGAPDKSQLNRTELWTKDVIEYLQHLLDEFLSKDGSLSIQHSRDQSPQMHLAGSAQHKYESVPAIPDGEEPALQFKWWYMVRILQWHHAEGLLLSSSVIEWLLNQLQEKESLGALQLLLPIVFDLIEHVALSQTYVRMLVDMAVRSIQDLSKGSSDVDNSQRPFVASALVEILRYLILAVPDTFVALDCFPLPPCVVPDATNGRCLLLKDVEKVQYGPRELIDLYNGRGQDAYHRYLSFGYVVSSIQKRAASLAMAVSPSTQVHGVAKAVQALDKALILGDVRSAYNCLFENLCDGGVEDGWIADVSPSLRSSLKWIGTVSLPVICSVFLLCEWATCDFRNCRSALPYDLKFTGRKDFSQVYVAVLLLKLRMESMHISLKGKKGSSPAANALGKGSSLYDSFSGGTAVDDVSVLGDSMKNLDESEDARDFLQSPGPLHDILVCWLDQHEVSKGEGFKRLQMLIMELIRFGIFYPQAYVRQLIVSGIMERNESMMDMDRRKRHHRIIKHLPGPYLFDALEEVRIAETPVLFEAMHIYSNERRLVLHGLLSRNSGNLKTANGGSLNFSVQKQKDISIAGKDGALASPLNQWKNYSATSSPLPEKHARKAKVAELKAAISVLLRLPNSGSTSIDTQSDESQGSLKRPIGSLFTRNDLIEGTPGCEECKRSKRHKASEERNSHLQGFSSNMSDDEDMWWVRKGPKPLESSKVDPPVKATKQTSRGRQKFVRKTQSLAHLAAGAARIEGSQGASTSHVCDSKISCPHHRTGMEGEIPKAADGIRASILSDIATIGKALKQLRMIEKRSIMLWLITSIRQLVEGNEKAIAMAGQCTGPFSSPNDDRSVVRWKIGEDELSCILYFLDVSSDLLSAVKFLLWLLPKARSGPNTTVHGGRSILVLPKNTDSHACEVGEAFLLSSIRRYENVLIALDLLPEALSAAMLRSVAVMTSTGRASGSVAFVYAKHLLKKFGSVASVAKWEKNFKATCDQRLLSELETARPSDSELGYSLVGVSVAMEDVDDYLRQKISGRLPRSGVAMKELVQRHIDDALLYFYGKERKPFAANPRGSVAEKWDDGFQIAQQIVLGLVECIRQSGGSAQEWDPSVVGSAVLAVVGSVGPAIAKMPDFSAGSNYPSMSSGMSSLTCARRVIHIHLTCLCLLKEALGERQSRVFEIALANEASAAISAALASGKASRSQFQLSPETHDSNLNMPNEILTNSAKVFLGRAGAAKAAAAVSALVMGAIVHGVATLERMVTVFRLKEGLDILQFVRTARSSSNGVPRSVGAYKLDNGIEVCAHWFRLLVGNSRTVFEGLVAELLGESYTLAISRMQRTLPLNLIFPPAYSVFAMVIWRPYIVNSNIATREDVQLHQSLLLAISDAIRHQPFRDVCLQDTRSLYDLLASDISDSEFAAMLELHGPDKHLKTTAFVPLRARLFLNAILDCKMPQSMQDSGNWVSGYGESKAYTEGDMKLLDQLVEVLDTLQPAKFHWQWVELRLLLNEQVLIEKIDSHNMPLVDAIRSLSPNADNFALSEKESAFSEIILTRLLVRPDAARLYSEVVHQLGRSMEESLLLHVKWFLQGHDVLLGRKSIRQRLTNVAQQRGLLTKPQFSKPWGWSSCVADQAANRGAKRKVEAMSLEEGEVVEEGMDIKRSGKLTSQMVDEQYVTEKALAELVLPCIDRSSSESRNTFANELIKQMNAIEQQISTLTRGAIKQAGTAALGGEVAVNKGNTRKGIRGGSPGLGRRQTAPSDSAPPCPAALRASMWLRLQFLLRLLPIIYSDREPSSRNMRHTLAQVLLRLLGSRIVHEDADLPCFPVLRSSLSRREVDPPFLMLDLPVDNLFDRFLCVLHGLLSSYRPSWLKSKITPKSTVKSSRDFSAFDRADAESLQVELDRMQLPAIIRQRLQAAMPMLPTSPPPSISCHPPMVPTAAVLSLQSSILTSGLQQGNTTLPQRSPIPPTRVTANVSGKGKPLPLQDPDMEIDPWIILEDGTGSGFASGNSNISVGGDSANLKACSLLKGAVRVRRTDLTYIGAVDDDT